MGVVFSLIHYLDINISGLCFIWTLLSLVNSVKAVAVKRTSSFEKIKHNPDENTVGIALFPPPGWMVITMKTLCRPKDLIRPDSEVIYCCDVC
jgi:hypothetical protein